MIAAGWGVGIRRGSMGHCRAAVSQYFLKLPLLKKLYILPHVFYW